MIQQNFKNSKVSSTLAINEQSNHLISQGKQVYKFGLGQSPFPIPNCVVKELKLNAHQKDYLPVKGLPQLREAISQYYSRIENLNYSPENVMIGPGSKELMFLLQLVFDGEVLIPGPSWVSYVPQLKMLNRNYHIIKTSYENKWLISPQELENWLKKNCDNKKIKLLILNYPNNPCGADYSKSELIEFVPIFRKYNILVLSDEIYGELNHNGNHMSIANFYPEGTIISSGVSKWCGAGGWRLGVFTFPNELLDIQKAMCSGASETYSSVSAPIQFGSIRAFRGGQEIENYLIHSRKILKSIGEWVYDQFKNTKVLLHKSEGGFYIFPDFSLYKNQLLKMGIKNSKDLANILLEETGVATLPGADFMMPSDQLILRLAYVNFNGSNALANSMNNKDFLNIDCQNIINGINALIKWINKKEK